MDTIYIRTLKRAEHTVFCVEKGQKTYYDPQFNRSIPYSSGQQVKRSIIDSINRSLNTSGSPTTFIFEVNKKNKELKEGEAYGTCNPKFADQLFGGWMKAAKGGKERTLKRRSPLSISAMRALHPLLAGVNREDISFDRSDRSSNHIVVRDNKGNELSEEEIFELLEGKDRSLRRKWIPDNRRATGLFVMDMAIDLRRLFSVSLNSYEPEITKETQEELIKNGWIESENIFGPCLTAPQSIRYNWINALANAIIDWKITSNQARTFSLMDTMAIAIANNANLIASSIRAKLTEEDKAIPIIEEGLDQISTYVTLNASGYVRTKTERADALEEAKEYLINLMNNFPYENQVPMAVI